MFDRMSNDCDNIYENDMATQDGDVAYAASNSPSVEIAPADQGKYGYSVAYSTSDTGDYALATDPKQNVKACKVTVIGNHDYGLVTNVNKKVTLLDFDPSQKSGHNGPVHDGMDDISSSPSMMSCPQKSDFSMDSDTAENYYNVKDFRTCQPTNIDKEQIYSNTQEVDQKRGSKKSTKQPTARQARENYYNISLDEHDIKGEQSENGKCEIFVNSSDRNFPDDLEMVENELYQSYSRDGTTKTERDKQGLITKHDSSELEMFDNELYAGSNC